MSKENGSYERLRGAMPEDFKKRVEMHVFKKGYMQMSAEKKLNDFLIADAEYRHKKMLMDCSPDVILKLGRR